jgi:hypothetical protein
MRHQGEPLKPQGRRSGAKPMVQPDTLQTGQIDSSSGPGAWCNTAESAADSNAVWVNCQHTAGPGRSQFFLIPLPFICREVKLDREKPTSSVQL